MEWNVYFFILFCLFFTFSEIGHSCKIVPGCRRRTRKIYNEDEAALIFSRKEDIWRFWNASKLEDIYAPIIKKINKESLIFTAGAKEYVWFTLYNKEHLSGLNFTLKTLNEIPFPKKNGLKVVCHGWRSSGTGDIIEFIKDAYLLENDVNIIGVDWSVGADSIIYPISAHLTADVGRAVAEVIDSVAAKHNYAYEDIHAIGHSLGAHVVGFAGRSTKRKLGRITGLDPALPGFEIMEVAGGRLSSSDAHFVDVIHTCVHVLGLSVPLGHADFYPNGGSPFQPGCLNLLFYDTAICSHSRAYEYFATSIRRNSHFIAIKCRNWNEFEFRKCAEEYAVMGDRVDRNARGIYYLTTSRKFPFYLGTNGTTI